MISPPRPRAAPGSPWAPWAAAALLLTGCSTPREGCGSDADCKGDRVCNARVCVDPSPPQPVPPQPRASESGAQGSAVPPPPPLPVRYAADGLPEEIPPPGSPVPTLAEWGAAGRIPLRGAERLGCEPRMLREWLRVNCFANAKRIPVEVYEVGGSGAFTFTGHGLTSLVVRVVRGKTSRARYLWDDSGKRSAAELTVSWPAGVERPALSLIEE